MSDDGVDDRADEIFEHLLVGHLESVAANARDRFGDLAERCDSPIEQMLLAALLFLDTDWHSYCVAFPVDVSDAPRASLLPQHQIGPYRVDFAVHADSFGGRAPPIRIAVECDGHEFHEKTREQAARDKKRDRYLVANGYKVMRFTGAEIWRDAKGCADQVGVAVSESVWAEIKAINKGDKE